MGPHLPLPALLAAAALPSLTGCALVDIDGSTFLYGTEFDLPGEHILLWPDEAAPQSLSFWSWLDDGEEVSGARDVGRWWLYGDPAPVPDAVPASPSVCVFLLPEDAGPVERSLTDAALARLRPRNPAMSVHVVVGAAPPPGTDNAFDLNDWLGATRRDRYKRRHHSFLHGLGEAVLQNVAMLEDATRVVGPLAGGDGQYGFTIRGRRKLPRDQEANRAARILATEELGEALTGKLPVLVLLPVGTPRSRRDTLLGALTALSQEDMPARIEVVNGAGIAYGDVVDLAAFKTLVLQAGR